MFLIFFAVIAIYAVIKYYLYMRHLNSYVKHLPKLKENYYPFIGNSHVFFRQNNEQLLGTLKRVTAYDSTTPIWLGPSLFLAVSNPVDYQTILTSPSCINKPYVFKFFRNEYGLFTAKKHIWRQHRKLLNPTFNMKILLSYFPIFNDKTSTLCERIDRFADTNEVFDIYSFVTKCTLDMVCATTFGYDTETQDNKNMDFLNAIEKISDCVGKRLCTIAYHIEWIYRLSKTYQIEKPNMAAFHSLPAKICKIKETEYQENILNHNVIEVEDDNKKLKPQIFIDQLLKIMRKGICSEQMALDQSETVIFGGNETSALTSSNIILMLAMHQDIQEKVVTELKETINPENLDINYATIRQLKYLEMVIKESMRVLTVGPFLTRKCEEDTLISDCVIPAGSHILMAIWKTQFDPKIWGPTADQFDPEHFSVENCANRHPYAFLPFSGGPRGCIGQQYAMIVMKIMLSKLLLKYKFTTDLKMSDLRTKWSVTMRLMGRHFVKIQRRE